MPKTKCATHADIAHYCRANVVTLPEMLGLFLMRTPGAGWGPHSVSKALRQYAPGNPDVTPSRLREVQRQIARYDFAIHNYLRAVAKRCGLTDLI